MKKLAITWLNLVLIFSLSWITAFAQEAEEITLTMSRDFGYSSGTGKIQGAFSIKAQVPSDVVRVVFYIDDQIIGEATAEPFKIRFDTGSFTLGMHTIYAKAFTEDERELNSKIIQREFVTAEEGWQAAGKIVLPILGLTLGISVLSFLIPFLAGKRKSAALPLGAERTYGALGGTICKKCGRPFSIHFLSIRLGFSRLDWCPHCNKWSVVRRYSLQELRAAEKQELAASGGVPENFGLSEEERLRKSLEESKYQD
jgi:hypothetical protein